MKYVKNTGRILMISFPKTNPTPQHAMNLSLFVHKNYIRMISAFCPMRCDPNADCALAFSSRLGSLAGQNDSWQAPIPSPLSFDWAALQSGLYCQDPVR